MHIDMKRYILILMLAALALVSCQPKEPAAELDLSLETLELAYDAASQDVSVVTNQASWSYELLSDAPWLSVTKRQKSISIKAGINYSRSDRSASIRISAPDGSSPLVSKTLAVKQKGCDITPELTLSAKELEVGYLAGKELVKVSSSIKSYECTSDTDWVSFVPDGSYLTVNYGENPDTQVRTADVTVCVPNAAEPLAQASLRIVQAACPPTYPEETLSDGGTSNSYLVSHPGKYRFDATVRGNGKTVEGLAAPKALEPAGARLIWQSAKSMVSSVALDGRQIVLELADVHGNAVVAATDAKGNVIWSWHIWYPEADVVGLQSAEGSVVMNMNLGALTPDHTRLESYGLLYQWGRKDPFPGSPIRNNGNTYTKNVTVYDISNKEFKIESSSMYSNTNNTLAYSIAHPEECLCNMYHKATTRDWLIPSQSNDAFWGNPNGHEHQEGVYGNKGSKTYYDPCPKGWRVPHVEVFKGISSTGGMIWATGETEGVLTWATLMGDAVFGGVDYNKDGNVNFLDYFDGWYLYLDRDKDVYSYFPATTRYDGSYGLFMGSMVGLWGNYWNNAPSTSSSSSPGTALAMNYGIMEYNDKQEDNGRYTVTASGVSSGSRADAYSVRCIKE